MTSSLPAKLSVGSSNWSSTRRPKISTGITLDYYVAIPAIFLNLSHLIGPSALAGLAGRAKKEDTFLALSVMGTHSSHRFSMARTTIC